MNGLIIGRVRGDILQRSTIVPGASLEAGRHLLQHPSRLVDEAAVKYPHRTDLIDSVLSRFFGGVLCFSWACVAVAHCMVTYSRSLQETTGGGSDQTGPPIRRRNAASPYRASSSDSWCPRTDYCGWSRVRTDDERARKGLTTTRPVRTTALTMYLVVSGRVWALSSGVSAPWSPLAVDVSRLRGAGRVVARELGIGRYQDPAFRIRKTVLSFGLFANGEAML